MPPDVQAGIAERSESRDECLGDRGVRQCGGNLPGIRPSSTGSCAFTPVAYVVGGLVIGTGMVVARSCVSGLFYKFGAGMLGAAVGIVGWITGELVARRIHMPGPTHPH